MIYIINNICLVVSVLIIWFHTEAFIEYSKLFRLKRLFKITEFEESYKNDFTLEYLPWLKSTYPNFFTKLITCPWCIGFWICLFSCIIFFNLFIFPIIYLTSLIIYSLIQKQLFS